MNSILKTLVWLCFAAAAAYMGYSWYTYSGLYRLIVEWQLETFGSFSVKMTMLAMTLTLLVPIAIARNDPVRARRSHGRTTAV